MLIILIILLTLLFLSVFFSLSETALASLSKFKIKKLAHESQRFNRFFELWISQPQYLLTTILVGNNIVNALFSSIATYTVLNTFHSRNRELVEVITWLSITLVIVIFGEITPKTLARHYPEKIVTLSLSPYLLTLFLRIFAPLNYLVNYLTQKFFRPILPSSSFLTREEIKILIRDILEEKAVDDETGKMLTKTVELCELKVEQIMTPWEKVESLDISEEPNLFIDHLIETGRTRIPIYRKNKENIIGYIYIKDLLTFPIFMETRRISGEIFQKESGLFSFWQKEGEVALEKIVRPVNFVLQEKKVSEFLEELKKEKVNLFIVVDNNRQPVGLVTLEDVLEEVIGEVLDEYDISGKR